MSAWAGRSTVGTPVERTRVAPGPPLPPCGRATPPPGVSGGRDRMRARTFGSAVAGVEPKPPPEPTFPSREDSVEQLALAPHVAPDADPRRGAEDAIDPALPALVDEDDQLAAGPDVVAVLTGAARRQVGVVERGGRLALHPLQVVQVDLDAHRHPSRGHPAER